MIYRGGKSEKPISSSAKPLRNWKSLGYYVYLSSYEDERGLIQCFSTYLLNISSLILASFAFCEFPGTLTFPRIHGAHYFNSGPKSIKNLQLQSVSCFQIQVDLPPVRCPYLTHKLCLEEQNHVTCRVAHSVVWVGFVLHE